MPAGLPCVLLATLSVQVPKPCISLCLLCLLCLPAVPACCARLLCPQDFRARIRKYEEGYETIMDRNLHYIKLIDMVTGVCCKCVWCKWVLACCRVEEKGLGGCNLHYIKLIDMVTGRSCMWVLLSSGWVCQLKRAGACTTSSSLTWSQVGRVLRLCGGQCVRLWGRGWGRKGGPPGMAG